MKKLLLFVLVWLVLSSAYTAAQLLAFPGQLGPDPREVLLGCLSFTGYWFLAYFLIRALVRWVPLRRERIVLVVVVHTAGSLLIGVFLRVLLITVFGNVDWFSGATHLGDQIISSVRTTWYLMRQSLGTGLLTSTALYAMVALAVQVVEDRRALRERDLDAARLESDLARAELRALRMQLQPHFLFNALNAVSVLIREDADAAVATLEKLGGLLRHSLRDLREGDVALETELEFLDGYLAIQAVRFGERLEYSIDCDDDVRTALVPPFILQPLVENAVHHGLEPLGGRGRIVVTARRRGDRVELCVRDDGAGLDGTDAGTGLGLDVTAERLARMYGDDQGLELRAAAGGGVEAVLLLPWAERRDAC